MSDISRVVIEGIDGGGKSTAAQETALGISENYPSHRIAIVDSTGAYRYFGGELIGQTWSSIESLEPHQATSKLVIAGKLGMFTLARRITENLAARNSDLLIGVRDPFRIDPATYARIFGPTRLNNLSPTTRLRLFNAFTTAPHPEAIIHLRSDLKKVHPTNSNDELDSHETVEKLQIISDELSLILASYHKLYGSQVVNVEGLQPTTSDEVAAQIEPFVSSRSTIAYSPKGSTLPQ